MHLVKAARSCVLLVSGLKRGTLGLIDCQSEVFFYVFIQKCESCCTGALLFLVRKRHHSVGLRVEAMKCLMSYIKFMYL